MNTEKCPRKDKVGTERMSVAACHFVTILEPLRKHVEHPCKELIYFGVLRILSNKQA